MKQNKIPINENMFNIENIINNSFEKTINNLNLILNKNIKLKKRTINILTIDEFNDYLSSKLNNKVHYITSQVVNGDFNTENIFLIDKTSVYNLANILNLSDIEKNNINDLQDLVLEISNILTTSIMSEISISLNTKIQFERPEIQIVNSLEKYNSNTHNIEYNKVIIISTNINFDDEKINGELLILSNDKTIMFFKNKLNMDINI